MNRRLFILSACAPFVAARSHASGADRFAEAWERYKASLGRQWQLILRLNERVKLRRAGLYDAQVAELGAEISAESRAQDAELKVMSRG